MGNEVVLFRHEKTFYHPAALLVRVPDTLSAGEIATLAKAVADYKVDYVGMALQLDGLAVEAVSGDAGKFAAAVAARTRHVQSAARAGDRGSGDHGRRPAEGHWRRAAPLCSHHEQLGGDGEAGEGRQGAACRARRNSRRAGRADREAVRRGRRGTWCSTRPRAASTARWWR